MTQPSSEEQDAPQTQSRRRRTTPLFRYTLAVLLGAVTAAVAYWSYLDDVLGRPVEGELVYNHEPKTQEAAPRGVNDGVPFSQDIRKLDAEAEFRKAITNPSPSKGTVIYADFNNDKVEDALVGVYGEGEAGFLNQAVYTIISGRLKLLWRNPDTLARAKGYIGSGQTVVMTGARDFDPNNAAADTIYTYRWDGSSFSKVE